MAQLGRIAPRECRLVPRTQRSTQWCAAEPGPIMLIGARVGPGSAVHRHSVSKTRGNALVALHRVRGTRSVEQASLARVREG